MKSKNIITKKNASNLICRVIWALPIFLIGFFIGRNYPDILDQSFIQLEHYSNFIIAIATVVIAVVAIMAHRSKSKHWHTQNKPVLRFSKAYYLNKYLKNPMGIPHVGFFVENVGDGLATKVKLKCDQKDIYPDALASGEKSKIYEIQEKSFTQEIILNEIKYTDSNNIEYDHDDVSFKP